MKKTAKYISLFLASCITLESLGLSAVAEDLLEDTDRQETLVIEGGKGESLVEETPQKKVSFPGGWEDGLIEDDLLLEDDAPMDFALPQILAETGIPHETETENVQFADTEILSEAGTEDAQLTASATQESEMFPDQETETESETESLIEEETEEWDPDAPENPEEAQVQTCFEWGLFDEKHLAAASGSFLFASQLQSVDSLDQAAYQMYRQRVSYYADGGNTGALTATYTFDTSPLVFDATGFLSYDSTKKKYTFDSTSAGYQQAKKDFEYIMQASVDAFLYDHPEVFWYRPGTYSYRLNASYDKSVKKWYGYVSYMINTPSIAFSGATNLLSAYENGVNAAIASIRSTSDFNGDGQLSQLELIQGIHDYLCRRLYYDTAALSSYTTTRDYRIFTSAGVFVDSVGTGVVCEGYAKGYKVLCDRLGISCILIGGKTSSGTGHMWNGIQIDGTWYLVDATWDDQTTGGFTYTYYLTSGQAGGRSYSGNFGGSSNGNTKIFSYPALTSHTHSFTKTSLPLGQGGACQTEVYTCPQDGITYWVQGHAYVTSTVPATCTTAGYTKYTCSVDGYTVTTDYTLPLGHSFSNGVCTRCGQGDTLANATVTVPASVLSTGSPLLPQATVSFGGNVLRVGTDYRVSASNNTNVGTATLTVTGAGIYTGSKSVTFAIVPRDLQTVTASAIASQGYTGSAQTPDVTLHYQSYLLKKDTDYTLAYRNNKAVGTATITVTGKGNFTGTKTVTFRIAKRALSAVTASAVSNKTYTGKKLTPAITLKAGTYTLKKNTDYTATYRNNTAIGTATITLTGKGNFTGTRKLTFQILPKKVTFSSLTSAAKKKATVKWKALSGITGYQIQYSTSSAFSGAKSKTAASGKTSLTLTGLTSGKTYYVRVRAYKTVSGTKYYGAWSTSRKVKVK